MQATYYLEGDSGHQYRMCEFCIDKAGSKTFNSESLRLLKVNIPFETKIPLSHVAGYVNRNDKQNEVELFQAQTSYFRKYGAFTKPWDKEG